MSVVPVHVRASDGPVLSVLGLSIRLILPSEATGGAFSLLLEEDAPGQGPPLHSHRAEEEFFHVLAGRYAFRVGDATQEAGPGDSLLVPRGTPHSFMCRGPEPGRLLAGLSPGGFEGFFRATDAERLMPPADMPRILALAARFHMDVLGPNPFAG
jgi:quercetin dioxygenase-like cupin family protein